MIVTIARNILPHAKVENEYIEEIDFWDETQVFLHDWIEIVGHSSS